MARTSENPQLPRYRGIHPSAEWVPEAAGTSWRRAGVARVGVGTLTVYLVVHTIPNWNELVAEPLAKNGEKPLPPHIV